MDEGRRSPSDVSHARRELIDPTLTTWREQRPACALAIGRPPEHDLRTLMDAILYLDRTGIPCRYLPHDHPPWATIYSYFSPWEKQGVFTQLTRLLRRLARQQARRDTEPSAAIIDSQGIKTATTVPAPTRSVDAGKKTSRRKPNITRRHPRPRCRRTWSPPQASRTGTPARSR